MLYLRFNVKQNLSFSDGCIIICITQRFNMCFTRYVALRNLAKITCNFDTYINTTVLSNIL